ncbi:MAG: FAD-dependent oxidoreductase [Gloeomargaritaceae cyanobacterium C42_A2020_066]|nr:FAD-dependent oxidoreductase [Gloeomargaritaceae cyanobacterium C42_A2020_066]
MFGLGTAGGALGYSRFVKPQPAVWQSGQPDLPRAAGRPLHVVVVGAGLAGLACAYELSQRGIQVTLLERASQLGGKVTGWTVQAAGETFEMEHGFHGFFPQYYNLNSLVDELAITDHFVDLKTYSLAYREGYQPEVFRPSRSAFPWNIVDLAVSSDNRWNWGLNLTSPQHWQVFREITGFDPQRSYERLDAISVTDWVKGDFPRGLYDLYFLPFAKSSLNAPDMLSAGELMQFFHFYFFGNPEGLAFRGTRRAIVSSLVEPMATAIRAKGGEILTDVTITDLHWTAGRIDGLTYQRGETGATPPFWVEANAYLADDQATYYGAGDRVYRRPVGSDTALSLTCPHQGCTVQCQTDGSFRCPCHGAMFDAQGRVTQGPAERDLACFQVVQAEDQRVLLATNTVQAGTATTLDADYYVLAADVRGIQHLFDCSTGQVDETLSRQVAQLAVADPFAVARFWFDRDFEWTYSWFTSLSGYRLTDSITLYHRIQDDYIAWAQATGGSVVELHAYCYKEAEFPTQEDLLRTFEQELYQVVPALQEARLLHRELVNQKNFSGFPPGSYAGRPATSTSAPNLLFAGDWVKMPFPCALMERAVSSGLLAANQILEREDVQARPLYSVHPKGVLAT